MKRYTVWFKEVLRGWRKYSYGLNLREAEIIAEQLRQLGTKDVIILEEGKKPE